MSAEDRPSPTEPDSSPEDLALILAEIEGMRAEREGPSASRDTVASVAVERGLDYCKIEALSVVCNASGPAEIFADHERRIRALERTMT